MQKPIESAVQIFRSFPDSSEEEILRRIIEIVELSGPQRFSWSRFCHWLTDAWPCLESGVVFPDIYVCLGSQGQPDRKGRLSSLPFWSEVIGFASRDQEPSLPIASRSAEVRAANGHSFGWKEAQPPRMGAAGLSGAC